MKKVKKKEFIKVSNVSINENVINELTNLFEMSPPSFLKRSLTDIFFSYLSHTEFDDYKPEIRDIAIDFYTLLKFLEVAEMYEKKIT